MDIPCPDDSKKCMKIVCKVGFKKNCNDAKPHYKFHFNRKIYPKNMTVGLMWIASANMKTSALKRTSLIVSISLETVKH